MSQTSLAEPGAIVPAVPRRRRWYTAPLLILRTCARTTASLHNHGLLALGPLFFLLLLFAVLLYLINAIAPVAPFVYSLI